MFKKWRLEISLGVLVLLTLIAVLAEKKILHSTIVITPDSGYIARLYDDVLSGGNSSAEFVGNSKFEWQCILRDKYTWPYCEYDVFFDPNFVKGVDLSSYIKIRVWLDYKGPSKTLRLYLRNFDPLYSKENDQSSTKYSYLEFDTNLLVNNDYVEFSLSDFFVANWWLVNHKIPPELSHPQFDNTVIFEVQTGTNDSLGEHYFKLNRVELVGQKFTTERWYLFIMIAWMGIFVLFLAYRITSLHNQVRLQKNREKELLEINLLLDVRSQELEEKSKTDRLTGAFNREGIEEALRIGLREWRSQQKHLSLVILDIDHFKNINDLYGHTFGDYVLTAISKLIKDHIRSNDLFARWGGEEFLLVCRDSDMQSAGTIAEKIRALLESHEFERDIKITASFGVASLTTNETLEQLFETADRALYRAKHQGRNRVVLADELG